MDRGGSEMLLQSIELKNFRQFLDEKIDFSTDPDKNVTLIIGKNGTGKTTFAQAFIWCLYGETDFTDKILLNRVVAERMTPNEVKTVSVILRLQHGSVMYEISRIQDYKKSYSNKVSGANTVLNIAMKTTDGNTRYLKPIECETEIKKILPKELSKYFFFDGERIEKMSKEIASGRKSAGFSEAVTGLTGLKAILAALNHLGPNKSNSVIGRFNENYTGGSQRKLNELTKTINEYQDKLNSISDKLLEVENQKAIAVDGKKQAEEEIKNYSEAIKLQEERESLQKQLDQAVKLKSTLIKDVCREFNNNMQGFFAKYAADKAMTVVAKSDFEDNSIPEMHSRTVNYLLNRRLCICGTHLDEGTAAYDKVKTLLDYLPPQSISVSVNAFKKEIKQLYRNDSDTFLDDFNERLAALSSEEDHIDELRDEITLRSERLSGDDVSEKVRNLNAKIKVLDESIKNYDSQNRQLLKDQGAYEHDKERAERDRSSLTLLDKNNRQIEYYKAYAQQIYDELSQEYKEKETAIRNELENSMNEIFKQIYNGGLSLSIDEKYNISVYVSDIEGGVETSTAQSISVIFAFIAAIIKMAKQNRSNESYSEPYPLVMDAPLSAFDKRRIRAICEAIPNTAEQVIIFIKDTDGDIAEEYLSEKINKRHFFEKNDEFHTKLI